VTAAPPVSTNRIIVGVPGPWADRSEVIGAIASVGPAPRFVAAGNVLMDVRAGNSVELETHPHDARMREAFEIAGGGAISDLELRRIAKHRTTAYLIGRDCSLAGARQMMAAAVHLLDAGGLAVKVESAGVAHPADRWRYHAATGATLSAVRAFVTLVGGEPADHHYSCGMHNLGLPDASVVGSVSVDDAAEILTAFNHWNLLERPTLRDGTWFSAGAGEAAFTARRHPFGYDEEDPLNNPLGRWHLSPTDQPHPDGFAATPSGQPMFMALRSDSPEIIEATRRARASVAYFREHFHSAHEYGRHLVKVRLEDGDNTAFFWTLLEDIDDEKFQSHLIELPPEFSSYDSGEAIECTLDELQDWAIIKSGTLVGGFSMRLQRSHVPEPKRHAYDLFTGTLSYAPLAEIPGA